LRSAQHTGDQRQANEEGEPEGANGASGGRHSLWDSVWSETVALGGIAVRIMFRWWALQLSAPRLVPPWVAREARSLPPTRP
jgi:hypothetical protein